jgi:glycosyltransferase involved in cell wall biosynthesis
MTALGTVGVAFPGDPRARGTWSGTPAGIADGLTQLGWSVRRIDARPPRALDLIAFNAVTLGHVRPGRVGPRAARAVARVSPTVAAVRGSAAAARLRSLPPLDAVVQIGTGYTIPGTVPVATYEDMTIPQAIALDYPGWDGLSERAVRARKAGQRRAYERATACCASTAWATGSMVADYGIAPAKVHAVGIGRNHAPAAPDRDWSAPRFLFVGVDWLGKNGPGVLAAFRALRAERPAATLDVVGAHPPLTEDGVTGHGFLDMGDPADQRRLESLYGAATAFVLPSHREAAGIAYVEAMSAGVGVIGSAAGGSYDLIGDAGCTVDPADGAALLAAMRRLADPATAQRLGAIARERAVDFTWPAVVARILAALGLAGGGDTDTGATARTATTTSR